jgi:hypothetical protein
MKIWEVVKDLEEGKDDKIDEFAEAKATMITNYGSNGKCRIGIITGEETLLQMIVAVFEFYEQKLKSNKGVEDKRRVR